VLILDTNHVRELLLGTDLGAALSRRLDESGETFLTTVVSGEEIQRGWLARIHSVREATALASAYRMFAQSIVFLSAIDMLPWDQRADRRFTDLRREGVRIGTLDLRIACITMEHDAVLLTRNALDFSKVPGLRIENWLD
jgi:tRNA(fMet)-specific endonuclease VapC